MKIIKLILTGLLAFTSSALAQTGQISFSPALNKRLNQGVTLRASSQVTTPRGAVTQLIDARNGSILGSATRVCLPSEFKTGSSKSWYLTNAHVVDSMAPLRDQKTRSFRIEMLESAMDLALLSSQQTSDVCLPIASKISLRMAYNIAAASNDEPARLDIEAYNIETNSLDRRRLETVIASSLSYGIPGREATGPLIFLDARGLPGMSGGAISGVLDHLGVPEKAGAAPRLYPSPAEELIGLVMAVDRAGRATVAISAPVIYQRLKLYFMSPEKFGTRMTERRVPGGVEYIDSQAIHYRHDQAMFDAGLSNLKQFNFDPSKKFEAPKLTNPSLDKFNGNLKEKEPSSDKQLLKQGDRKKIQELMMGTGRTGDGGIDSVSAQSAYPSGLVLKALPNRRWLSIGNDWSEAESLFPTTRKLLKNPNQLTGIYEENGYLFATSDQVDLPAWTWIPDAIKDIDVSKFDVSGDEKFNMTVAGKSPPPCWETVASSRKSDSDLVHGALVVVCETGDFKHRSLRLLIHSSTDKDLVISATIDLVKTCIRDQKPCPLELKGQYFFDRKNRFPFDKRQDWLRWSHSYLQSLPAAGGSPLKTDGLRSFGGEALSLNIERYGGYRISLASGNSTRHLAGPTAELVSEIQPDLATVETSAELVRSMKAEFDKLTRRPSR